jgi:hypothetical protein
MDKWLLILKEEFADLFEVLFGHLPEWTEANRDKMSEPKFASCNFPVHIRAYIAWDIVIGDAF